MPAWIGRPHTASSVTTTICGSAIATQANRAACSTPICTGSDITPMRRSPSIDLKSLSVMMPWPPALYSAAMANTRKSGIATVITAAPVTQGRPS